MIDLIAEYEKHLKRRRRAAKTISGYLYLLRRIDRELPAGLIGATTDELEAWIWVDGRSDMTLQNYTTIVKGFTSWAANPKDQYLDYDAAEELPNLKAEAEQPARAATPEEIAAIFGTADRFYLDFFTPAAFAGMRCIEISRFEREHLREDETRIYGKGGKKRTIATHPLVWQCFKDRPDGPLVRDRDGTPLTADQISHRGFAYLHRIGHDTLSMHSLRKYFGTQVYEMAGNDIRAAQEALGHAYVTTTQKYVAVNRKRMAAAVLALAIPGPA